MKSEEQWVEVDRCPICNSPIYKKDDEVKFTGPPGCCEHSPEQCGCEYRGNDMWSCGHIDGEVQTELRRER